MGVHLIAQRAQFGLLRGAFQPGGAAFGAVDFAGVGQSEVERGPGGEEEIAADRILDDLDQREMFFAAKFHPVAIGEDVDRVIDVEHVEIGRCHGEREGRGKREGGDDADAQGLRVEAAQHQVEDPGRDDADDGDDGPAGGQLIGGIEAHDRGAQRDQHGIE